MKYFILAAMFSTLVVGCNQAPSDVGVVPLKGIEISGKVVEAGNASGVLVKTDGQRTALLPDSWRYQQGDQVVQVADLQPGSQVRAYAPDQTSRLVSAADKNLVLTSQEDTFTLPYEALPTSGRGIPVQVSTYGGQSSVLPLSEAISNSQYTVMPYPGYTASTFPQADRFQLSKAVVVGGYNDQPLVLTPGQDRLQAYLLPQQYYPTANLSSNQPVRFTYADENVQVQSWNSLTNGQIDLGDILLAGTLLQALPGQAVVEVGNRPVTVPWDNLRYNNAPVAWNTLAPGSAVDLRYYPGVYDIADYNDDMLTLLYNQQVVQIPTPSLPDYLRERPVYVSYNNGRVERVPFRRAQRWVDQRQCQFVVDPKHQKQWKKWHESDSRLVRDIPGRSQYMLAGNPRDGLVRVQPRKQDKPGKHYVSFGGPHRVERYQAAHYDKKLKGQYSKHDKHDKHGKSAKAKVQHQATFGQQPKARNQGQKRWTSHRAASKKSQNKAYKHDKIRTNKPRGQAGWADTKKHQSRDRSRTYGGQQSSHDVGRRVSRPKAQPKAQRQSRAHKPSRQSGKSHAKSQGKGHHKKR